jgi:hypothetical protein
MRSLTRQIKRNKEILRELHKQTIHSHGHTPFRLGEVVFISLDATLKVDRPVERVAKAVGKDSQSIMLKQYDDSGDLVFDGDLHKLLLEKRFDPLIQSRKRIVRSIYHIHKFDSRNRTLGASIGHVVAEKWQDLDEHGIPDQRMDLVIVEIRIGDDQLFP